MSDISGKSLREIYKEDARKYKESIAKERLYSEAPGNLIGNFDKSESLTVTMPMEEFDKLQKLALSATTDKLSVEKLQEELENCIQTLISISILANDDENIVIGNFVDSRLPKFAKTHENVTKYIEKVTGKNIDVVLAENAALEALEGEKND
ncbi:MULTISPECIES: hypothetical protein [unclassified Lactococcus]|uniref:hypothetical protein n=1 Tax=unclassified Lactococcus TaxID=2643510 RepID=UPI001EECAA4F|nr:MULTISPECIES: hypothetical protein [unclassified Lactococcus]